jgi:hypothetical protein
LNNDLEIDRKHFPGFARLADRSDWYFDTLAVSDNTIDSVPSILTGKFPRERALQPTVAEQPRNLFTLLRPHYRFNVAETVTSLCPAAACPKVGPGFADRFQALWLDLAAVYLHRVTPEAWSAFLPDVETNWSGFFAERQLFFPGGWLEHTGSQTLVDHVDFFREFIASIAPGTDRPGLHFMHTLFPHEPLSYLPDGRNYGHEWLRGQTDGVWEDHAWGLTSGKQRNFLQVQLADRLLDELLDRLQQTGMLDQSIVVLVADHGASFEPGTSRRSLTPNNAASVLRVPLFFKRPGQVTGRRIETPAMIHDLLPTLLSELGADHQGLSLDGLDLHSDAVPANRRRYARQSATRNIQEVDMSGSRVDALVRTDREQLGLDDAAAAIWRIGPFARQRGQRLDSVCRVEDAGLRYRLLPPDPLPSADPADLVPAYIKGEISGREAPDRSLPFLVVSAGVVAGSGYTWKHRETWNFFTLVEPSLVEQAGWSPRIYLFDNGICLQGE